MEKYDDEQLNRRPTPDKWSALMVMHHVMIAEKRSLVYLKKKLSYNPELRRAGLGDRFRSLVLTIFLKLPFKFKAPDGVGDDMLPVRTTLAETVEEWRKIRRELWDFLEELPEELWQKSVFKHALAGRMSLEGMLLFFRTHFDRHHKQIERTLGDFESSVFSS